VPPRTTPCPLPTRVLAAAGASALLLAGCGGEEPGAPRTVTVTSTPTASSAPPSPAASAGPTSDVTGRAHDVGTFRGVEEVAGTTVLTLDRWTYADWSEERVAQEGVPLQPLTDMPFRNQNDASTYAVPVSPDVVVGLNSCTVGSDGTPRIATEAGGPQDLVAGDTIWLLDYTDGVLTQADTIAPC
jgi:hypothetical protein